MIYVNIPEGEYKASAPSKKINGVQHYYARFNAVTTDGIVHAVEAEIDHKPTKADFEALAEEWLASNKKWVRLGISAYGKSEDVKAFNVNGSPVWMDSETRVSVGKAIDAEEAKGRTETVLYLGGVGYNMTIAKAREVLRDVEVYAKDCYTATETHLSAVENLTTVEEVEQYNYRTDYPERLSFEL